jgi:hypothetical protein
MHLSLSPLSCLCLQNSIAAHFQVAAPRTSRRGSTS